MSALRKILTHWVMPTCFAVVAGKASAQAPIELPALPDASTVRVTATSSVIATRPLASTTTCTPDHCTHRTSLARRRCKRHLQELFLGYPEEFERPPLGALIHAAINVQVSNSEAASMVLYHYDFEGATSRLNLRGRDKLAQITVRLPVTFVPVIVERTNDPLLDQGRRLVIIELLAVGSFPVPPERVVVGLPLARGLQGNDAVLIHEAMLSRTAQSGPRIGVGVTPSTSPSAR